MQFIEFEEAGVRFEIQGPLGDGRWLVGAYDEGRWAAGRYADDRDGVGPIVDGFLKDLPPDRLEKGFRGLVILFDHSRTGAEAMLSYRTRGQLLAWFDDGTMPTLDEVVEQAEFSGGKVVEVRDCDGMVLLDRRPRGPTRMTEVGPFVRMFLVAERDVLRSMLVSIPDGAAMPRAEFEDLLTAALGASTGWRIDVRDVAREIGIHATDVRAWAERLPVVDDDARTRVVERIKERMRARVGEIEGLLSRPPSQATVFVPVEEGETP